MTSDPTIHIEDADDIRSITLNRPEKINALTATMMHGLADAIRTARPTSLIVIKGRGERGFCAGADIMEFIELDQGLQRQGEALVALSDSLLLSPCIILTEIHGRTLGAGVLITALSDLVIASDNLGLGLPEIHFNMYPALIQAALEYRISPSLAQKLSLSGRILTANEALAMGLASHVASAAHFAQDCTDMVAFYRARRSALEICRAAEQTSAECNARQNTSKRIRHLMPLLLDNFSQPAIRGTIRKHLKKSRSG